MNTPKKYIGEIISIEPHGNDVKVIKIKFDGIDEFSHVPGQFVMLSFVIVHFVACMWYFSSKMYDFSEDTWIVRKGYQ